MSRFIAFELANQTIAQQVEISDGVEDFVLHELVFVSQPILIEDLVIADCNSIIHTGAKRQIAVAKLFEFMHEPKGPRPADFLHKRGTGKVDGRRLGVFSVHGMIV